MVSGSSWRRRKPALARLPELPPAGRSVGTWPCRPRHAGGQVPRNVRRSATPTAPHHLSATPAAQCRQAGLATRPPVAIDATHQRDQRSLAAERSRYSSGWPPTTSSPDDRGRRETRSAGRRPAALTKPRSWLGDGSGSRARDHPAPSAPHRTHRRGPSPEAGSVFDAGVARQAAGYCPVSASLLTVDDPPTCVPLILVDRRP